MRNLRRISFLLLAISSLSLPSLKAQTGTGSLRGNITDETRLPLVGATIVVDQLNIATIADPNGNYQLLGVPSGKHTISISFIGYNVESREVEIRRGGVIVLDVKMSVSAANIQEVTVYGQARGQVAAVLQQLNAKGISNVVSVEKLQELPDVNIAEAVGRLPGLMVDRDRGEGQKLIIRGLQPKYNTISIGGNIVPSTSTDDRSTDLNMISPDILGGVEVMKANTADMDASGLGGTVNLILKEAPSGLRMKAGFLTGFNSLSNSISNYRGNFHLSNRFFDEKLGVMLSGNADLSDRDADQVKVLYNVQGDPVEGETYVKPWAEEIRLQSNIEERTRAGGSLLLDWQVSPSTTIKTSSFVGYLKQEIFDLTKQYTLDENYIEYIIDDRDKNQLLYSNSIEGRHFILSSKLDWGASRSQSNNESPYRHQLTFRKHGAFNNLAVGESYDIEPPELIPTPENVNDQLDQQYFYEGEFMTYKANETVSSLFLNLELPYRFKQHVSGYVKVGTKYRAKVRSRENELHDRRIDSPEDIAPFIQQYPETILTEEGVVGRISVLNFLDEDYKPRDFLNNQYEFFKMDQHFDHNKLPDYYNGFLKDFYWLDNTSKENDYDTRESIFSYYLMTELNIGRYITFIPGVRYERSDIEYGAYIAREGSETGEVGPQILIYEDTLGFNNYGNIFPQIHLKIKPTNWFDIRLAYTNTISRADYDDLAPRKLINSGKDEVDLGDTKLKPALSENYDIILTFFQPKYGLLTLGAFYKEIEGFHWRRNALIRAGTDTDPANFGLTDGQLGFIISYPLNNPHLSTIMGFEMDIQSNMKFLPVKGFVFNMNLTLMESETKYAENLIRRVANPDFGEPGEPRAIFVNFDTAYVDRLLKQPSYLANIGLGYDNRKIGLSVRLSFNFQDDILTKEQKRPDAADREGTLEYYRWDFQVNQRITKRLKFRLNVANIFNQPDRAARLLTGYFTDVEYYGTMVQFGLRYTISSFEYTKD